MAGRQSYLLEFQTVGNAVKVCAIDPQTGEEVSIVGPTNIGQEQLSRLAVRKLQYVLRKRGRQDATAKPGGNKGRGLLV